MLDNDLEVTPVFVKGYLSVNSDLIALSGWRPDVLIGTPKHGTADLAFLVFQRKVPVAGRWPGKTGQFAFHPHLHEAGFEQVPGLVIEFGNAQCSWAGVRIGGYQRAGSRFFHTQ